MRKAKETGNSTQSEYFLEMAKERLMLEEFLLENVNINQRDTEGRNALYWAIKTSHKYNIDVLLNHDISLMVKPNYHVLFHTIRSNNLEAFAFFLNSCKEINMQNSKGQTLLMVAIEMKNSIMVQYLINHGINLFSKDNNGLTALQYAKKAKNRMIFDLVHYKIVYEKSQDKKSQKVA